MADVYVWDVVKGLKPAMLMVVLQMTYTGINVLYKLAVNDGMNLRVVIAYRYMFALFLLFLSLSSLKGIRDQR
ncbi:hypothetical protein QN277_019836 [Acacia crassicarpa]|uniref:WAT1-related protein n=1 Tax=Acacia crassicarpa TaxID=499986 RepID=A0AAE1JIG4_9FABA|nr:hypothetical protein QN277_019836 [Acacia crassicarpa]